LLLLWVAIDASLFQLVKAVTGGVSS